MVFNDDTAPRVTLSGQSIQLPPIHLRDRSDDHLRDECGLFGVIGHEEAATLTYLGLYALQHRGQEGAGIVVSDDGQLNAHRGIGLVSEVFKPHKLARLRGRTAIGHVRYSTTGSCTDGNAQPLLFSYAGGQVAVAHNGNLINAALLRRKYEEKAHIFQTTSDTEVIIPLLATPAHQPNPPPPHHVLNPFPWPASLPAYTGTIDRAGRFCCGLPAGRLPCLPAYTVTIDRLVGFCCSLVQSR